MQPAYFKQAITSDPQALLSSYGPLGPVYSPTTLLRSNRYTFSLDEQDTPEVYEL